MGNEELWWISPCNKRQQQETNKLIIVCLLPCIAAAVNNHQLGWLIRNRRSRRLQSIFLFSHFLSFSFLPPRRINTHSSFFTLHVVFFPHCCYTFFYFLPPLKLLFFSPTMIFLYCVRHIQRAQWVSLFVIDALFLEKMNSNNTREHKKSTEDIKERERKKAWHSFSWQ